MRLKSGGPKMTVRGVVGHSGDEVATSWFNGKKHETGFFPIDALAEADPSDDD